MNFRLFLLLLTAISCSNSDFRGGGVQVGDVVVNGNSVVQTIPLNASSKKVDLVWLIDNSGSMGDEAANVRNNFSSFISTLGSSTDLKLALISSTSTMSSSGGTGVTLPVSGPNYLQVPTFVNSNDALSLAAVATCPNNGPGMVCGQPILTPGFGFDPEFDGVNPSGKLVNFFRSDAHRVYVVVTDDEAYDVNESNFLSLVTPYSFNRRPTVFAFIGKVSQADCHISRRGTAYESLAATTGGETFDICEKNWQPHFAKLTSSVENIASKEFILNKTPVRIVSVKLDGQVLATTQYSIDGNKLVLADNVVSAQNKMVTVEYTIAGNS